MLDFIKELMPLLEGAKDGAIWLIAAYFGLLAMKMLLVAGVLVFIAMSAKSFLTSWLVKSHERHMSGRVKHNDWNTYQWDEGVHGKINAIFSKEDMQELLRAVSNERGFIHGGNLRDAAERLRSAK